jgi:hypothetical protein
VRGRHLLISGIPSSGKSSFGRWLATTKKFVHVDMEKDGLDRHGLRDSWEAFWRGQDHTSFLEELEKLSFTVLDWGFPPSLLGVVSSLKAGGVDVWWFDGDRLGARSLFEARSGQASLATFDCQYARIVAEWSAIAQVVRDHVLKTVREDGSVMASDEIWERIGSTP